MSDAVLFPDLEGHWLSIADADPRAAALYHRHYSSRKGRPVRTRKTAKFTGPGEYIALLTGDCSALFVWRRERFRRDNQVGVNCAIFRNEGSLRSSDLIREACEIAWRRWPGERLFTFVEDTQVSTYQQHGRATAGWCYRKAGWKPCGRNADGRLTILEVRPTPTE